MRIVIINGPNLNLVGIREKSIYGNVPLSAYLEQLLSRHLSHEIELFQSNVEGEIINKLQEVGFSADGIVLNGGAYTHTSIAIADAIAAITTPVVEVHISNIYAREELRHISLTARYCRGLITGFGLLCYDLAIWSLLAENAHQ